MSEVNSILEVKGLCKSFPGHRSMSDVVMRRTPMLVAVDNASFDVERHQVVGIVGESGSGKTTIAKCIVRLHEPESGQIRFESTDVRAAKGKDLRVIRRAMQMIYQDPFSSLNPLMTVEEAIREPGIVHNLIPSGQSPKEYVAEQLELVGLSPSIGSRRPSHLSGGERQRVVIARAMAAQPELLIADEPVSALDVSIQAQVLNLFEKLRCDRGLSMIFVAHQLSVIAYLADVVQVMYLARIVEGGPAKKVFLEPGHPYTVALLGSQPGRQRRGHREAVLAGEPPSPLNIPSGCRFRTRCRIAQEICKELDPEPTDLGGGHKAWCHFAGELSSKEGRPS